MENKIQIIIAEDSEKYRKMIIRELLMLESLNIEIIGEAANGLEVLELLKVKKPDVLFLDLSMPVMDGNKAFDEIMKYYPLIKVVILSSYWDDVLIDNYLYRGAKGYIPKDQVYNHIMIDLINTVSSGGTFIMRENKTIDKSGIIFSNQTQTKLIPMLTNGLSNREIAKEKGITERAVEKSRQKIYLKIGVEKAFQFYKYAFTAGWQFLGIITKK